MQGLEIGRDRIPGKGRRSGKIDAVVPRWAPVLHHNRPSYPAHAGYPVCRGFSIHHERLWNTGSSASDEKQISIVASEAKQSMRQQGSKSGLFRGACHRARIRATRWLAMTVRKGFAISRREAPEFCSKVPPSENRGRRATPRGEQGMPGARCARSLACKSRKHASKSPRSRRNRPAFPAQWF
jgi:hypothetical protein